MEKQKDLKTKLREFGNKFVEYEQMLEEKADEAMDQAHENSVEIIENIRSTFNRFRNNDALRRFTNRS